MTELDVTLKISQDVRDRLGQFGKKDETFDQIISRLLDLATKNYHCEDCDTDTKVVCQNHEDKHSCCKV